MVSGSYKVGNFKPQIGFAYGKSSIGEDYKHVAVSTDYSFSKRTTATLGAGWLKENVNPKYDEDLPKKIFLRRGHGIQTPLLMPDRLKAV